MRVRVRAWSVVSVSVSAGAWRRGGVELAKLSFSPFFFGFGCVFCVFTVAALFFSGGPGAVAVLFVHHGN